VNPLVRLFETDGLPSYHLPEPLERLYGGSLGFEAPRLYANFVSSLDGVVALEDEAHSSQMISGKNEADRFVMGLLRACADVILIGAGTLRAAPDSLWTPAFIFPDAAEEFATLRRDLDRTDEPRLVVLTARGELDPGHRALAAGAIVLTTDTGATNLGRRLPAASEVRALGHGRAIDFADVIATLLSDGHEVLLSEGGPTVIGGLLQAGLLHELFLTVSPILAGRWAARGPPGRIGGVDPIASRAVRGGRWSGGNKR
jgi:riboflavin biosynthesis pyrimidine reductase